MQKPFFYSVLFLLTESHLQCYQMLKLKIAKVSKSCPKSSHSTFYLKSDVFKGLKSYHTFGLILTETLTQRIFKNRPIWSHCSPITVHLFGKLRESCSSRRESKLVFKRLWVQTPARYTGLTFFHVNWLGNCYPLFDKDWKLTKKGPGMAILKTERGGDYR